jgi:hypothetical protein
MRLSTVTLEAEMSVQRMLEMDGRDEQGFPSAFSNGKCRMLIVRPLSAVADRNILKEEPNHIPVVTFRVFWVSSKPIFTPSPVGAMSLERDVKDEDSSGEVMCPVPWLNPYRDTIQ